MAISTRQQTGRAELDRIAASAGYAGDVPGYLIALKDMSVGLKETVEARQSGQIDEWGFVAHVKNYTVAMKGLLQGAPW